MAVCFLPVCLNGNNSIENRQGRSLSCCLAVQVKFFYQRGVQSIGFADIKEFQLVMDARVHCFFLASIQIKIDDGKFIRIFCHPVVKGRGEYVDSGECEILRQTGRFVSPRQFRFTGGFVAPAA